jgi:hypothetical protein
VGKGDETMSIGEARVLHKRTKLPVLISRADGRPVISEMFSGIPYLLVPRTPRTIPLGEGTRFIRMVNCGGHRPYIEHKGVDRWTWKPYKPIPADIVFTKAELAFAEPYRGAIMVEPNVKNTGHDNKAWLSIYWSQLDLMLRGQRVVQCGPAGAPVKLRHAEFVETPTFRHACAVLSVCKAFIGTEGGLHHAAAAVGVPGVVIYGGFISPAVTGYDLHRNLFTGTGLGCGWRVHCEHCRKAMTAITPTMVMDNLKEIL